MSPSILLFSGRGFIVEAAVHFKTENMRHEHTLESMRGRIPAHYATVLHACRHGMGTRRPPGRVCRREQCQKSRIGRNADGRRDVKLNRPRFCSFSPANDYCISCRSPIAPRPPLKLTEECRFSSHSVASSKRAIFQRARASYWPITRNLSASQRQILQYCQKWRGRSAESRAPKSRLLDDDIAAHFTGSRRQFLHYHYDGSRRTADDFCARLQYLTPAQYRHSACICHEPPQREAQLQAATCRHFLASITQNITR